MLPTLFGVKHARRRRSAAEISWDRGTLLAIFALVAVPLTLMPSPALRPSTFPLLPVRISL